MTSIIRNLELGKFEFFKEFGHAEWTWSFKIKLFLVVFFILAFPSSIYFSTEFGEMILDSVLRFVNEKWNPFFILISCRYSVHVKKKLLKNKYHFPLENYHLCSLASKYRERRGFLLLLLIWSWWFWTKVSFCYQPFCAWHKPQWLIDWKNLCRAICSGNIP